MAARVWRFLSPRVHESTPGLPEILRLAAQRSSGLLLVLAPVVEIVAVATGISDPGRALVYDSVTELGILSAFLLARTRPGLRRPEVPLTLLASVMIVSLLFAPWHLLVEVNVYAMLAPMVPLALAAFAPLPPSLFLLLGVEVALLHPIALVYAPSRWSLDPWVSAALALSLATMAAAAARSHRALWSALMSAREKALDATRLKSEFLANMSHEIRTPMTAILGFADELKLTLQSADADDPARAALLTIQRNGEHLLALINGILDLSKIEAGKLEVVRTRFSPIELVADVARLLGPRARDKRLRLEASWTARPETIQSDAVLLRQIVINLVGTRSSSPAGSVRIVVRLAATAAGRHGSRSRSRTPASGSTSSSSGSCSSRSRRCRVRRPGSSAAPVWACRSRAGSRGCSPATSSSRASRGAAARSARVATGPLRVRCLPTRSGAGGSRCAQAPGRCGSWSPRTAPTTKTCCARSSRAPGSRWRGSQTASSPMRERSRPGSSASPSTSS
jgi:signal transduction histidine kinase